MTVLARRPTDAERIEAFSSGESEIDWDSPQSNALILNAPNVGSMVSPRIFAPGMEQVADSPVSRAATAYVHPVFGGITTYGFTGIPGTSYRYTQIQNSSSSFFPSALNKANAISVSCWVNVYNAAGSGFVVFKQSSGNASNAAFNIDLRTGNEFRFLIDLSTVISGSFVPIDQWTFLRFSYHNGTGRCAYTVGSESGDLAESPGYFPTIDNRVFVVGDRNASSVVLQGSVVDIRYYAKFLEKSEVEEIRNRPQGLYRPKSFRRRFFLAGSGAPPFPDPDNMNMAGGRSIDLNNFFSYLMPRTIPSEITNCSASTRPAELSINVAGALLQAPLVGDNYLTPDWQKVEASLNRTHVLKRTGGDSYSLAYSIDVGASPINVTITQDFNAAGPDIKIRCESSGGHATPSEQIENSFGSAPYDCGQTYSSWNFVSGITPDVNEGGIDFTSLSLNSQPSAAPVESGALLWEFKPLVSFSPSDWQNALDQLPVNGTTGRPIPSASDWARTLPPPFDIASGAYWMRHQINYEQPTMDADGWFNCKAWSDASNPHTQFQLGGTDSRLDVNRLLPTPNRYRFHVDFDVVGTATDWQQLSGDWAIVIDLLHISTPAGWIGGGEPEVALYIRPTANDWRLRVAGASAGSIDWTNEQDIDVPAGPLGNPLYGRHTIVLEVELDGQGVDSYTAAWLDGRLLAQSTGANALNDGATNPNQLHQKIGNYHAPVIAQDQVIRIGRTAIYAI